MKFNTYYSRTTDPGEMNNLPSMTVPDQSMTIREIINRTKKGLPVTGVKVPIYNETEDGIMPDLKNMDISEIAELKQRIKRKEAEIRKQLEEADFAKQQAETEAFYRKKFGTAAKTEPTDITPTEEA